MSLSGREVKIPLIPGLARRRVSRPRLRGAHFPLLRPNGQGEGAEGGGSPGNDQGYQGRGGPAAPAAEAPAAAAAKDKAEGGEEGGGGGASDKDDGGKEEAEEVAVALGNVHNIRQHGSQRSKVISPADE